MRKVVYLKLMCWGLSRNCSVEVATVLECVPDSYGIGRFMPPLHWGELLSTLTEISIFGSKSLMVKLALRMLIARRGMRNFTMSILIPHYLYSRRKE
jgi:hypothetical protein